MDESQAPLPDVETEKDLDSLFLSLVENLPVHVARKNLRGEITFANQAFCRLLGLSRDAVIGKTDFDFFPKDLAEKYRHDDMLVESTGQTFSDIEANFSGGETHYFEVRKTPVQGVHGKVVGTQVIFWDVSAHKRTEAELDQERQLLNALLANTPDHIVFKDAEGRFIRVSRAHARCVGCQDPANVIGKSDADFFPSEFAERSREDEQQVMRSGRSLVGKEEEIVWPNGQLSWVSTTKAPLRNYRGEVVGTFGISRDITNRKLAEETQARAAAAAEAANRAKSDFLANMSHEIRTPLNAIIGMTELVLDSQLAPIQQDYLQTVLASGETLLRIINQILDFSKIEARRVELEAVPFSVRDVLGDTLKSLAFQAHSKGLELAWHVAPDVPDTMIGDPTRLTQIVMNLVGNAIKFTSDGEVVLRAGSAPAGKDLVRLNFTVSDTGVGIPEDQQSTIFSAFEQADTSTTREYGGTGLGLSISSRIAELMNGEIWVESQESQGSTFHVELCFGLPPESAEARNRLDERLSQLKVLVVDDNETNRLILVENLKAWNVNVTALPSAAEALDYLETNNANVNLVITDHQMPQMDGVQLIEQIRKSPDFGDIPIIVLTSGTRQFELPKLRRLNVSVRLLKPVKPSELKGAIESVVGISEDDQEPARKSELASRASLRILLAEDGWANQKLAAGLLEKWGHHVTIANDGQEAVNCVKQETFDLVLMDLQMPVMDGLEATREIRRMREHRGHRLPILAMTAHVKVGDEQRCLEAGMDGYLSKPVRQQQLRSAIQEIAAKMEEPTHRPNSDSPAEPTSSADQGFDLKLALDSVEGDEELLKAVIDVFFEECPRLVEELGKAIEARDASTMKRVAHTLKGATRIFGFEPVSQLTRKMENDGGNANFKDTLTDLPKLKEQLGLLTKSLRSYVGA